MQGLNTVIANLDKWLDRLLRLIYDIAQENAPELEAYAKENAVWTDRTGHARQSLNGSATQDAIQTLLILAHGVDYGKWLELAHSGKYAILLRTIEENAATILRDVTAACMGMGIGL